MTGDGINDAPGLTAAVIFESKETLREHHEAFFQLFI
jgi:high-affinity K+ transport system ATPase subunit B